DAVKPVAKLDAVNVDLKIVRRSAAALIDRLVTRECGRVTRHHNRARGNTWRTGRNLVTVALNQPDRARVDTQPFRHKRNESRQMPFPHPPNAGPKRHPTPRSEAKAHHLIENTAGNFQEAADADAAQLAGSFRTGATRRKFKPFGLSHRLVQNRGEVATIVD